MKTLSDEEIVKESSDLMKPKRLELQEKEKEREAQFQMRELEIKERETAIQLKANWLLLLPNHIVSQRNLM